MGDVSKNKTLFCGNLSESVTDELLYELFLQAGPLEKVTIPVDTKTGRKRNFAFITFQDAESVPYTVELMRGVRLFGRQLGLQVRTGSVHTPQQQWNNNAAPSSAYSVGTPLRDSGMFQPPGIHRSYSAPLIKEEFVSPMPGGLRPPMMMAVGSALTPWSFQNGLHRSNSGSGGFDRSQTRDSLRMPPPRMLMMESPAAGEGHNASVSDIIAREISRHRAVADEQSDHHRGGSRRSPPSSHHRRQSPPHQRHNPYQRNQSNPRHRR